MLFAPARLFRVSVLSLSAVATALLVAPAQAATVNLGGNWTATWDSSLDALVSLTNISISGNTISFTKNAIFAQPQNPDGSFNTIPINFVQIGASTVDHIVIENEVITNNSGSAWNGFRMDILAGVGIASFNPALTLASGGPLPIGFGIAPFTTAAYSNADKRLDFGGGIVANGAQWLPGSGANGGQLWINVNSTSGNATFQLKETPLPEPGAMALLTIAGMLAGRRGRRR